MSYRRLATSLVLVVSAACSKSVLGPDISGRDYSAEEGATDGISSSEQPAGDDGEVVDTTPIGEAGCYVATTRNVYYPGGSVSHSVTCEQSIETLVDPSATWPSYLSLATSLPATTAVISGTAGAAHSETSWTARVNDTTDVSLSTEVLSSTPAFAVDATISLSDDTAATVAVSATLDASYDGTVASMEPLPSDLSDLVVGAHELEWSATDVPLLAYERDTCASLQKPYFCPGAAGSLDATTNEIASTYELRWDYDLFDQGQYDVASRGYILADDAEVASSADVTRFVIPDLGGELTPITGSTAIGNSNFMTSSAWHQFVPAIALNDEQSTSPEQIFGVVYAASNGQRNQYAGIGTIDRATDQAALSTTWFDPTTAASRLSNAANTGSMALAATDTDDWLALGGQDGAGGSRDLILNNFNYNGGTPSLTRIDLSALADGTYLGNVAMTAAFNDGGTKRHGVAFYGRWDPAGADTQRLYVSKIRSTAGAQTEGSYFDAGAYYDAGSALTSTVASVPIVADQNAVLSLVRIVPATIGGTNYFYVGWRNEGDGKVSFARVEASSSGVPTVNLTDSGDEISSMANGSVRGRASYDIAAGTDAAGNAILGVVYAQQTGSDIDCNFVAYELSGSTLALTSTVLSFGAVDCRFVRVWFNASSGKFMALYMEGDNASAAKGDTFFVEFEYDGVGDAFVPASPTPVKVTDRADVLPCLVGAGWSATWHRLGIVSIEGACAGAAANMKFDVYKTGR